ncbi:hypothetical protein ADUPG1_001480, partial [Aduncisulcus paluster]
LILQTDASDYAIGAALLQKEKDGTLTPIVFVSKVLSDRESRWTINEKEAFAVKHAVEKCEHYLRGATFSLETDHANLLWMSKAKSKKVQRWWTYLADFRFDIKHIKGTENSVADALSRVVSSSVKRLCIDTTDITSKIVTSQGRMTKDERECYDIEDGKVIDKHGWLVIPKDEISLKKEVYETFHSAVAGHHAA